MPAGKATRVVLAESAGLMYDALCALLRQEADIHLVAAVSDADAVVDEVVKHNPHVLLLGYRLAHSDGPRLREALSQHAPRVAVVTVTGAEPSSAALLANLRRWRPPAPAAEPTPGAEVMNADELARLLSPRELEVLRLIASGYTNQESAHRFGISVKTVEGYRARVMRKLGVRGRAGLVRVALQCGLLSPGDDD